MAEKQIKRLAWVSFGWLTGYLTVYRKKKKKRSAPDWRVVTGLILNGLGPHLCERMSGPRPVVLSGPSGAGKSTLLKKLMKDHEGVFGFSVSRMFLGLSLISIHGKTCCTKENSTIN